MGSEPTPTPTPTPYPYVCVPISLDRMYPELQLGPETVTATPIYDPNFGLYYKLSCTQNKTSFDYYEIHDPITIKASTNSYRTYLGFIASYDPNTEIYINLPNGIDCDSGLLKAIYR